MSNRCLTCKALVDHDLEVGGTFDAGTNRLHECPSGTPAPEPTPAVITEAMIDAGVRAMVKYEPVTRDEDATTQERGEVEAILRAALRAVSPPAPTRGEIEALPTLGRHQYYGTSRPDAELISRDAVLALFTPTPTEPTA